MKLYFYNMADYDTLKEALDAKATRVLYLDDVANPSLKLGAACDIVEAIASAVDLCGGNTPLQFILTTEDDKILDVF